MKRILRYGLTTPLRSFEEPEHWTGEEEVHITGALILTDITTPERRTISAATQPSSTAPVQIRRTVRGNCRTHIDLLITKGSTVAITETITGSGALQSTVHVSQQSDTSATYTIVQDLDTNALALLKYHADVHNASLHWLFVGLGANTTQAYVQTNAGERSKIVNNAALCGTGNQQFDIHVATNHVGAHSTSNMLTRSVLDDESRAVYHGLIHINPDAPECDSYQKDEVILLSANAGADAIPDLEIQNNRVRCSHGATIGRIDAEQLFYLRSRGITEMSAKRIITEGFMASILPPELLERVRQKLDLQESLEN